MERLSEGRGRREKCTTGATASASPERAEAEAGPRPRGRGRSGAGPEPGGGAGPPAPGLIWCVARVGRGGVLGRAGASGRALPSAVGPCGQTGRDAAAAPGHRCGAGMVSAEACTVSLSEHWQDEVLAPCSLPHRRRQAGPRGARFPPQAPRAGPRPVELPGRVAVAMALGTPGLSGAVPVLADYLKPTPSYGNNVA